MRPLHECRHNLATIMIDSNSKYFNILYILCVDMFIKWLIKISIVKIIIKTETERNHSHNDRSGMSHIDGIELRPQKKIHSTARIYEGDPMSGESIFHHARPIGQVRFSVSIDN